MCTRLTPVQLGRLYDPTLAGHSKFLPYVDLIG